MSKELELIILELENLYSFIDNSKISKRLKGYAIEMKNDLKLEIEKALKRNNTMKVIRVKNNSIMGYANKCPNCDIQFHFMNENVKYCPNCGQKLDRGDSE